MPFTLAHPAAILPLRRFCPRYLSLGALIMGSVAPDAGYCFGPLKLDHLSHSFAGSFVFSLPVGMLMLAAVYAFRHRMVEWMPVSQREILMPLCRQAVPSPWVLILSVLIGAWTHLLWDSLTHGNGWFVRHVTLLRFPIVQSGSHTLMLCHLLWYGCSFGGVACLCYLYEQWTQKGDVAQPRISPQTSLWHALFVGFLVLPIEVLHHLAGGPVAFAVVGFCSIALVIGAALGLGNPPRPRPQKES